MSAGKHKYILGKTQGRLNQNVLVFEAKLFDVSSKTYLCLKQNVLVF